MATKKTAKVGTRSILVYRRNSEPLIVSGIPDNAKITFGALQPGKDSYDRSTALRVYTTANNQLAVFTDVASFRDLSLTIQERKVTKASEGRSEVGPDGEVRESQSETTYEWVEVSA